MYERRYSKVRATTFLFVGEAGGCCDGLLESALLERGGDTRFTCGAGADGPPRSLPALWEGGDARLVVRLYG